MRRRYDDLQEFFLGYFHPDWRLDSGSRQEVVSEFISAAGAGKAAGVIRDLRELLAEGIEEPTLHDAVLKEYSLFYDPWRDEITMTEWLEGLLKEVEAGSKDG